VRVIVVTGTSTGVGKTVASAALVTLLRHAEHSTAMVKPVQTGAAGAEPGDAATIARLSGCADVAEIVTLDDPLAPDSAARLRGLTIPTVKEIATAAAQRFGAYDVVIVEGAGGVLVRLDTDAGTLIDLADEVARAGHSVEFVVVTSLSLGTLNHTELTVATLCRRGLEVTGLIVGVSPDQPDLAAQRNLVDLPRVTGLPILAQIPAGAGSLTPAEFQRACPAWFSARSLAALTGKQSPEGSTTGS
jgi:dethiobiotin synthetase